MAAKKEPAKFKPNIKIHDYQIDTLIPIPDMKYLSRLYTQYDIGHLLKADLLDNSTNFGEVFKKRLKTPIVHILYGVDSYITNLPLNEIKSILIKYINIIRKEEEEEEKEKLKTKQESERLNQALVDIKQTTGFLLSPYHLRQIHDIIRKNEI